MRLVNVNVVNNSNNELPKYEHFGSAGMDLRANINEPVTIMPNNRVLIPTGLHVAIPEGYELQIRSRSGLALKKGIFCLNSPGTIDHCYTGDVGVILANFSNEPFVVEPGDRIAQAVLNKFETINWVPVSELEKTDRGDGGFGSTGVK